MSRLEHPFTRPTPHPGLNDVTSGGSWTTIAPGNHLFRYQDQRDGHARPLHLGEGRRSGVGARRDRRGGADAFRRRHRDVCGDDGPHARRRLGNSDQRIGIDWAATTLRSGIRGAFSQHPRTGFAARLSRSKTTAHWATASPTIRPRSRRRSTRPRTAISRRRSFSPPASYRITGTISWAGNGCKLYGGAEWGAELRHDPAAANTDMLSFPGTASYNAWNSVIASSSRRSQRRTRGIC